ncbi:MAG: hypothetical protein WC641_05660 [Patescibacteria group bacterium]
MTTISLLFDQDYRYLGELTSEEGMFAGFMLSKDGEEILGKQISEWQTSGLSIMGEKRNESAAGAAYDFFEDKIMPRDKRFTEAFRHWVIMNGLQIRTCSPEALGCWEKMLALPFEAEERCVLISAIRNLPHAEIAKWSKALDGARGKAATK